jgi:hypothetical protein
VGRYLCASSFSRVLQVHVGQYLGICVRCGGRPGNQVDGPGLTVGAEDRGLLVALRYQNLLLAGPFGGHDFGPPFPFGVQNGCALVRSGLHLFLHGLLIVSGGSIALISTRFTRIPHLPQDSQQQRTAQSGHDRRDNGRGGKQAKSKGQRERTPHRQRPRPLSKHTNLLWAFCAFPPCRAFE